MNPIVKKYALKFGRIGAAISVLFTLVAYLFANELFVTWYVGVLSLVVNFVLYLMAVLGAKKEMGGYISFKDSFSAFVVAAVINIVVTYVLNIVLFTVLDQDMAAQLQEMQIEKQVEMMETFGTPEEAMEEAITQLEENDLYSVESQLKGIMFAVLFAAVIGLLVAAVTKKAEPIVDAGQIIDSED